MELGTSTSSLEKNRGFPDLDVHIGQRLRHRRKALGWTLMDLSERLDISHQPWQKYEQGFTKISASMLYKMADAMGIQMAYFFEGYHPEGQADATAGEHILLTRRKPIDILLIEDNPADELLTRKALESANHEMRLICVHDGETALELLKNRGGFSSANDFPRPDLILLDINVPKIDGFELLREIKKDKNILDIPVVMLTNSISRQEMGQAYRNFASGYVCKSFDFNYFKQTLGNLLNYWNSAVVLPHIN